MPRLEAVTLEMRHAVISGRLRECDVREIRAADGIPPDEAVRFCIGNTDDGWAFEADGDPWVILGAVGVQERRGIIWLLGTDLIYDHPVWFHKTCARILDEVLRVRYDELFNWVGAENETSLRWLEALGFAADKPEPFGAEGLPFRRIHWERTV
ncbi:MAG: hypothetical protein LBR87_03070 [Synergistaceae bacterium]|jgi:hypothetical protein|nr:hypothetical protein [Synergistaceae bacterium]